MHSQYAYEFDNIGEAVIVHWWSRWLSSVTILSSVYIIKSIAIMNY